MKPDKAKQYVEKMDPQEYIKRFGHAPGAG